jgi:hypothetical protein
MNDSLLLPDRILRLLQIFRDGYNFENKSFNLNEDQKIEFNSLWKSIVEDLMWSPGTLIHIEDETERKAAQIIIDLIWKTKDVDEIFDEMTSGGYSGLLVNIIGDYIDRAKMLKPTLISINTQEIEFNRYFEEAMKAWLHGLNSSSLILCGSIIEDIIKTQLYNIDPNLALDVERKGKRNKKLFKLIDTAFSHHIIDNEGKETAHRIRILRNDAVHKLKTVSEKQTYRAILDTKELIEKILTVSGAL